MGPSILVKRALSQYPAVTRPLLRRYLWSGGVVPARFEWIVDDLKRELSPSHALACSAGNNR